MAKQKLRSFEQDVEIFYQDQLKALGVKSYVKTEPINKVIDDALAAAPSKQGGTGKNYPDIKILLKTSTQKFIPVMIEAKGAMGKLIKEENHDIANAAKDGSPNYKNINGYAVNGAIHYANAILDSGAYDEVIAIGVNGWENESGVLVTEFAPYLVSIKNRRIPKLIPGWKDFSFATKNNVDAFVDSLQTLVLTDEEMERLTKKVESTLEEKVKAIHQSLYENEKLKSALSTNQKLYLFCGLIMAGLKTKNISPLEVSDLKGNDSEAKNDGTEILGYIEAFLKGKNCSQEKINMILELLGPSVFKQPILWRPVNGESLLKELYRQIKTDIIPLLESNLHLDFTGRILNSLGDWVHIENDSANDVVLTPRYVTKLMVKLARTNKDSYVWDTAMGSAGFLVAAMEEMIKDAENKIKDTQALEAKKKNIRENQLLGIEILGNVYILAVLNMILMGDGSSNIIHGDSFDYDGSFKANVYLLNPPYSQYGKGLNFVETALNKMIKMNAAPENERVGYACVLIQENAGSGNGLPYAKRILEHNKLVASIHMSDKLFCGKASVQTAIYVFEVGVKHEEDDIVTFIDFSNDGYSRQNRKKSSQEINLKDTDHAVERYAEVEAIVLGKKPKTKYYTEENGLVIKDTISLEGNDWTFVQHKELDLMPTEEDFKKTVVDYLAWKVGQAMKEGLQ